ncbi:MAG: GNAT family N-acetyltransferase [Gammaproteobacteria bacterium]|nr:GNAT family N-acetyltransferase [Gammaproteobacteria bacterium]
MFQPLTKDNWRDFERLFGERGGCGGCWCMLWRLSPQEFKASKGDANRQSMRRLAKSKRAPGVLVYRSNRSIGWCAIAPRDEYPALGRSRILKPIDDRAVWSVSCFFIDRAHRKQGVSVPLLKAAVEFARAHGATMVEGYPVDPVADDYPAAFAWTGIAKSFQRAQFKECLRRSPTRPIMRIDTASLKEA